MLRIFTLFIALFTSSFTLPFAAQDDGAAAAGPRTIDPQHYEYFLLQAVNASTSKQRIRLNHIGAFTAEDPDGFRVTAVLDDYPAQMAGLRQGDLLLTVNGSPFHPLWSFNSRDESVTELTANSVAHELEFARNGSISSVSIEPVFENLYDSLRSATLNSIQQFNSGNKVVGYVRLWNLSRSGNDLTSFARTIASLSLSDGLILDLRDSYGFITAEHLDQFFPTRSTYFEIEYPDHRIWQATQNPRLGSEYYGKAMVVIVNGNTRSGMELFAYQLGKLQRVVTLGESTPGLFGALRQNGNDNSLTYIPNPTITVDGVSMEAIGVTPEQLVSYPLGQSPPTDPQFDAAVATLMTIM